MEVIILAGGFGTRLKKEVPNLPKPMAPIAGRPFLEILLKSLSEKGFSRIILSLGYMSEKIVNYFGDNFLGMDLIYVIEDRPLGTGGAIRKSLEKCNDDHVLVLNGDTFIDIDVKGIEEQWQKYSVPIIVACTVPDTLRYGRLKVNNGRVTGFSEKNMSGEGLINAGCYLLPVNLLEKYPEGESFSFETDFLYDAVNKYRFDCFMLQSVFIDIGVPEDFERAQTLSQFQV
jgi:D-glycero-alpha-D-manno-heptose 1-phosphate guanylyltransferase